MPPTGTPTPPVDVGTPRVEVQRIPNGTGTWKVMVPIDASEAALIAAKNMAVKIDAELTVHYDREPRS
jgi:hypothetical protein